MVVENKPGVGGTQGASAMVPAILGGHIRMMSGTLDVAPHVQSGKLRLLATLGSQRNKAFPNLPTIKEAAGTPSASRRLASVGQRAWTRPSPKCCTTLSRRRWKIPSCWKRSTSFTCPRST